MSASTRRSHRTPGSLPATWTLQDAKARLSEVVRRAQTEGPQHVTVHGREEAVVLSAAEFRQLKGEGLTGPALIDVMRACPYPELDFDLESIRTPARDVEL
jgi:prevent-host-death family protein